MARQSSDELAADGSIRNGYDYNLQVWVLGGFVLGCTHPDEMRRGFMPCCNANRYKGERVSEIEGHEIRPLITEGRTIWNSDGTDGPCLICPPPKKA